MNTQTPTNAKPKWSLLKKLSIFVFIPFVVFIAILAMVPLFYSVDYLRPQIEAAINQKVKGKVSLGKLSLKTIPSLGITIDSVTATPAAPYNQIPLVSGSKAELSIPLSSILIGPKLNITLKEPNIHIVSKGEEGSLNSFLPAPSAVTESSAGTSNSNAATTPNAPAPSTSLDDALSTLPPWLASRIKAAKVSLNITNAKIVNDDQGPQGSKAELNNFNFSLKNVGLMSPIDLKIKGDIKFTKEGLLAEGPIESDGNFVVEPQGKENKVTFKLDNNLKGLTIKMSDLFRKESGADLSLNLEGVAQQSDIIKADLSRFALKLASIEVSGKAKYQSPHLTDPGSMSLDMTVPKIDLGHLGALVPMIRTYNLDGDAAVDIQVAGTPQKPTFNVDLSLNDVKGSTPELKHPISQIKGKIKVVGTPEYPQITIDPFSLKIASSDLSLKIKTAGIAAPKVDLFMRSNSLNIDEIMGVETSASAKKGGKAAGSSNPEVEEPASTEPLDESLDKMAPTLEESLKNPILDKAIANLDLEIQNMKMTGAKYKNVRLDLSYAKRNLQLKKAGLGAYRGDLSMTGNFGLEPSAPSYNINAQAKGLNLGDAIAIHAPAWKNDMSGLLFGTFSLSGVGIRKAQLAKNLGGGLKGDIKSGKISIPLIKLLAGVIESLPSGLGSKVKIPQDKKFNGEFKTCALATQIKGRNIIISSIDVLYDTMQLGIGDVLFKAKGNVNFDRHVNLEGMAFLDKKAIPLAGIEGPSGKAEIPVKFAGLMSEPKMDYAYTMKILGPRLAKGELKKHEKKIKDVAIKAIKKKAPKEIKSKLEDFTKKFKF